MKLLSTQTLRLHAARARRGAALLLSFLVLLVVIAIVYQIHIVTSTDSKVAHNDITLTRMDLAIESAMMQVFEQLADDAAADTAGAGGDPAGGDGAGDPLGGSEDPSAEGGAGEEGSIDSKMDEWARPQSTTINEVELRIFIQDEDSKYNVLNMLNADEDLAQAAYDRVVRILDACREGTRDDIDGGQADEMATVMREHFLDRGNSILPRATLITDDEENENLGLPLSLRELIVLEPYLPLHFRDYFDSEGQRVHSIESFLTVWTAPSTGALPGAAESVAGSDAGGDEGADEGEEAGAAGGSGGYAVNINTAPFAVLTALMDDRDLSYRFWDSVLEYRNEEEEPPEDGEEPEPMLDEFGEEILRRKFFDDLTELSEVYGWTTMESEVKEQLEQLLTVSSNVFSVYITARRSTAEESLQVDGFASRRDKEIAERSGLYLSRTVRAVVWRDTSGEEATLIPLLRWDVVDYAPLEVLDYEEVY